MSQINLKKQSNALTQTPLENYVGLFYSTELDKWAYKDESGNVMPVYSIISGGTTGQVLAKASNAAGDVVWVTLSTSDLVNDSGFVDESKSIINSLIFG